MSDDPPDTKPPAAVVPERDHTQRLDLSSVPPNATTHMMQRLEYLLERVDYVHDRLDKTDAASLTVQREVMLGLGNVDTSLSKLLEHIRDESIANRAAVEAVREATSNALQAIAERMVNQGLLLDSIENQVQTMGSRIELFSSDLSRVEKQITQLRRDDDKQRRQHEALEQQVSQLMQRLDALTVRLDADATERNGSARQKLAHDAENAREVIRQDAGVAREVIAQEAGEAREVLEHEAVARAKKDGETDADDG